jgi:hypothetical protein
MNGLDPILDQLQLKGNLKTLASTVIKGALIAKGNKLLESEVISILQLYKNLLETDKRNLQNIPKPTIRGLGAALMLSLQRGQLKLVSIASPHYIREKGKVIIGNGREKKEYTYPNTIRKMISKITLLPHTYVVYLSDIDPETTAQNPEEIKAMFQNNLEGLRKIAGEANKLSVLIDCLEQRVEEAKGNAVLKQRINQLQRSTVIYAHSIAPEAIGERAYVYAAIGKLLEQKYPEMILLDIQGKVYPYEQPFYDALRTTPLPLLRLAIK